MRLLDEEDMGQVSVYVVRHVHRVVDGTVVDDNHLHTLGTHFVQYGAKSIEASGESLGLVVGRDHEGCGDGHDAQSGVERRKTRMNPAYETVVRLRSVERPFKMWRRNVRSSMSSVEV